MVKKTTNTKKEKNKKTENNTEKNEELEHFDDLDDILDYQEEFGEIFAAWEFPEFEKHHRSRRWYIVFTVVFLALMTYAYFTNNLLFAIIITIFSALYFSADKKDPKNIVTAITEDGIILNNKIIEYKELNDFYIIYQPPQTKNLYLHPKNELRQRITIPLMDQDPVQIREALLRYLPEDLEKEEMPASEALSKILKL